MINFKGVEVAAEVKSGLGLGIHEVTISGVVFEKEKNDKATPYADVTFLNEEGDFSDKFHLTQKALPKLKHLLIGLNAPENILEGELTEEQLKAFLTGKKVRICISGREYMGNDGTIKVARELGFSRFAESILVSKVDSKLKFDNVYNIKKLPSTATAPAATRTAPVDKNDLPF